MLPGREAGLRHLRRVGSHGRTCSSEHCAGATPPHKCNLVNRKKSEAMRASPRKRTAGGRDPDGAQTDPTAARPRAAHVAVSGWVGVRVG